MTFLDQRHGLALSDPVGGKFRILATDDGGRHWQVRPTAGMPAALDGEFAFAASGTCLVSTQGRAYFATGGGSAARIFSSRDGGRNWSVVDSPIPSGASAGIYSLAFRRPVARDRGGWRLHDADRGAVRVGVPGRSPMDGFPDGAGASTGRGRRGSVADRWR